jgi:4-hydroxy-tetrahydrodipicolinate reductase
MKIALFGYGKMGRIIEKYAIERGHDIVLIIDENNYEDIKLEDLKSADVAIDFSTPNSILANIHQCFDADLPLVVGTTGWYDEIEIIREKCLSGNHSLLYGSNFSVGVNVFFHINKLLAKAMRPHHQYEVQVEEIHHTAKLDAPSGTAITIAEGIIENSDGKTDWVNYIVEEEREVIPKPDQLLIESHRIEDVP